MRRLYSIALLLYLSIVITHGQVYHGTTIHTWFNDIPVSMYLPQGYFESMKMYPVLYLLAGTGDTERTWFEDGHAEELLNKLIGNGSAHEMIVVMPQTSGKTDGSYEENFKELTNYIERHFRVYKTKKFHAIAGLSLGGFYAMHIAHHMYNEFDYVGLFSTIYTTNKKDIFKKSDEYLFGISPTSPKIYKNVEKELKKEFRIPPKLYFIAIGKRDFLYNQNTLFRNYLDSNGFPYIYNETGGGHEWKNWQAYLTTFLPLLFEDIPNVVSGDYNELDEY